MRQVDAAFRQMIDDAAAAHSPVHLLAVASQFVDIAAVADAEPDPGRAVENDRELTLVDLFASSERPGDHALLAAMTELGTTEEVRQAALLQAICLLEPPGWGPELTRTSVTDVFVRELRDASGATADEWVLGLSTARIPWTLGVLVDTCAAPRVIDVVAQDRHIDEMLSIIRQDDPAARWATCPPEAARTELGSAFVWPPAEPGDDGDHSRGEDEDARSGWPGLRPLLMWVLRLLPEPRGGAPIGSGGGVLGSFDYADAIATYARRLEDSVGGADALAALDAVPLPDEPFDWTGVPDDIRPQVEAALELADGFCEAHGDVEFRTAVRRLLAIVARNGPTAFRRNASDWSSAAAICKILGEHTGLLTPYRGTMTNKDFMAYWGRSGSVKARGDAMLRAAGIASRQHLPAEALTGGARAEIVRQRDALPALLDQARAMDVAEREVAQEPQRLEPEGPAVFTLKVTIGRTKPPVWRRLEVPGQATLADLHEIIQTAFEWGGHHLHEFAIGRHRFAPDDEFADDFDLGDPTHDEAGFTLAHLVCQGDRFTYTYDFGDDWEHKIVVESARSVPQPVTRARCTGGRRAAPPDDIGGPWGYNDLVESLSTGRRPDWLDEDVELLPPDFDPAEFDAADIDELLGDLPPIR